MSNVAYTPKDAPATVAKPGRVLICRNGECKLSLKFGVYFDGTGNNQELGDRAEDGYSRTDMARRSRWFATAGVALFALALVACAPKQPDPDATFGSSVTAMDHDPSDTFVRNVFVDGTWVGEASMGGGIVAGGISLPYRWRPGLTAVVRWERCDRFDRNHPVPDEEACRWTEKVVPIQKYERVGGTWLHLLSDDEVLIIPSMVGPGHPAYPGPDLPTKDFFHMPPKGKEQTQ
ncbi:DUF3304 domain-containing protein [Lysobacter soli]|uniref:DUF3304 domain-containing protein n=1 Tax=Lysobacter soli TaxID=453783 RepID=A0A3D8VCF7_9GAMM|nr:DUF3304 domain-containing protein [Lysobacter soli]RDY67106.1 DUF3304 domain-containing protein [Lysobacter soli]